MKLFSDNPSRGFKFYSKTSLRKRSSAHTCEQSHRQLGEGGWRRAENERTREGEGGSDGGVEEDGMDGRRGEERVLLTRVKDLPLIPQQ